MDPSTRTDNARQPFPMESIETTLEAFARVLARHLADALKPLIAEQVRASTQTTQTEELPALLKVEEAAKLLRIGRDTAYELVRTHQIPSISLGRRIVIPTAKLFEFLNTSNSRAEQ